MIKKVCVVPYLPDKLKPLMKIVNNLWWVWNFEAIELFQRLDVELWREVNHNPIVLLGQVPQRVLEDAAQSDSFLAHMERVEWELDRHLDRKSWFFENIPGGESATIAYFSAEFGIHESLPIYSGGLGILAGDHLKSASELGVPLFGVGLLYRLGYFRQYLNLDGWQQEKFPQIDFHNLPVTLVRDEKNNPLLLSIEYPGRDVFFQVWEMLVGRITLYLLDTNVDKNAAKDRILTDQLYGGDEEMRIQQEILLGIGGVRALEAIKKEITVFHMNEGHAAFLALERIRLAMEKNNLSYEEAYEFVTASNVFTTHTPVPAGNDRFDPKMVDTYFHNYYPQLGLTREGFLGLGREDIDEKREFFCMTVLAIKCAAYCNGVSRLHGHVSRRMWKQIWQDLPEHEIPIGHITNGIHTLSWTSDEMMRLFNRYLGPRWIDDPANSAIWQNIDDVPDSELWRCRERLRERLVGYVRKRLHYQLINRGMSPKEAARANSVLDPEALTIGFARRFATYKRATLILRDLERLQRILNDKDMPVQIIFAGKAHPRDNMGKELIKQVIHLTNDERFRNKIAFLEDYDIKIARYLVQGVDVWLNTPIRPKEASGTSGMKVIPNGGLNISVLDGWWDEAYNANNGWAIGKGEEYNDHGYQDEVESLSLYNIIEQEVRGAFYNRGSDGTPTQWVAMMRESLKTHCYSFNTNRMVQDYSDHYYKNAHNNHRIFSDNNFAIAKKIAGWKQNVLTRWDNVKVKDIIFDETNEVVVGSKITVLSKVILGEVLQEDVSVELYFGALDEMNGSIISGVSMPMQYKETDRAGYLVYEGEMLCLRSGQFALTVRVVPQHEHIPRKFAPEMKLTWSV